MSTMLKAMIEELVREEAGTMLAEGRAMISDMIRKAMIPELRAMVRQALEEELRAQVAVSSDLPPLQLDSIQPESRLPGGIPDPADRGMTCDSDPSEDCRDPSFEGFYVYGVIQTDEPMSLGPIGVEENEVRTVSFRDLSALVHGCGGKAYQSKDEATVKGWVLAHQRVVDAAWEKVGTVIPAGFDTIILGNCDQGPDEAVKGWLEREYDRFRGKLAELQGKAEYGIQVFWDAECIARKAVAENPEICRLQKDIQSKPRGLAYLYREKLQTLMKREMERLAEQWFDRFYAMIKTHVVDLHVGKISEKESEQRAMMMNLSCLLQQEGVQALGEELEKIEHLEGFGVRFTGPWPPYSFV